MWPIAGLIQKVINNTQTLLNRISTTLSDKVDDIFLQVIDLNNKITPYRASQLDNIRPSVIKNIRHGYVFVEGNTTTSVDLVPPVDPNKTFVIHSHEGELGVTAELLPSGDWLDFSMGPNPSAPLVNVSYTIVEYW